MSIRNLFTVALGILALSGAFAQQKPGQAPSAGCASCHSSEVQMQPRTAMGRALELVGDDPLLKSHPRLRFQKFGYTYTVETRNGQTTYSVTDGTRTISLPIRWNFGSHAQTWMLERDGDYYESLVSYYPSIDGLEITTGDANIIPATLDEAIGRKLSPGEAKSCFGCHATDAVVDGEIAGHSLKPGVKCEHCHTGAIPHLFAAVKGEGTESAPPDLRRLTSEDLSSFCGQCHRSWSTVIRGHWRGEMNVRFQPYRLANSKCFSGTDPRISCIVCHDPHKEVVTNIATYDGKCLACHAGKGAVPATTKQIMAKACPVGTNNCASCHMPEVKLPNGLLNFHDHMIRIVKAGEPYPD